MIPLDNMHHGSPDRSQSKQPVLPLSGEDLVHLIGTATSTMVWSWDVVNNRVIAHNKLEAVFGKVPPDLAGAFAWWKERAHPDERGRILKAFETAFLSNAPGVNIEYSICDVSGVYRVVDDRLTIIRDADGVPVQIIGAARDISERRSAQRTQSRLVHILEATPDIVAMAGIDGCLLHLNLAGRKLIGLPQDTALDGRSLAELFPPWAMEIVLHEGIPRALSTGVWEGETAVITHDGHELPVSQIILAHSRPDGSVECLSTIMRDITERKQEEVARIEWANRYDAAIRASGQLLIDWNSITNELTYGGSTEEFFGYDANGMLGGLDRLRALVHPDDQDAFDREIQRITATRDPFFLKFRLCRRDGKVIHVQAKGFFFLDREGRLARMVGFLGDVSSQHEAQEELARAHESLESRVAERTTELARAYLVIQDRALQQEAVAHLGQQALAGVALDRLMDEATALVRTILKADMVSVLELTPDGSELVTVANAGWATECLNVRLPINRKSQSGYTIEVREPVIVEDMDTETRFEVSRNVRDAGIRSGVTVMIATGEQIIGVLSAFTLTRRVFTKDDVFFLQSAANVLTYAIARQRAEEILRLAREQAETANRAKSEFLSRMSHELRTPLNAILGFTQLLELEQPTPSQAESIEHISRAGKHLLSLINEVLDIARIESGRLALAPESIALGEFLRGVLELIRPLAQRFTVELILDESCNNPTMYVLADYQRLRQVMLNLLSNAVKYNRANGRVVVSCSAGRGRWRISVSDTGCGIPKEKLSRLFIPFERLGAEATDIEGTGIGLALSQGIVLALNGEIGVESVKDVGSTFWVELPTAEPSVPEPIVAPPQPEEAPIPTRPRTLLYIEDQDLNLRLVERILLNHPQYKLISSMQGRLALDLAREHQPDLILLDLNLPDMHGEEVLSRIKQDPNTWTIPVIMVSADAMGDRIEQLLSQGASGYLTKPYKVSEFLRVIEETLIQKT